MKTFKITSLIPISWGDPEVRQFLPGLTLTQLETTTYTATITIAEDITEAQADAIIEGVRQHVVANLVKRA